MTNKKTDNNEEAVKELAEIIEKLVRLCERCLEGARYGDFSNGITASGLDEGAVNASNYFNQIQQELQALQEGMKG